MSEWKKTMLETGIDDFLELVAKKGIVTATEVADELSLSLETVESWAEILAKEGLVTTEYDRKGKLEITNTKKNTKEKEIHLKELTKTVKTDILNIEANVREKEKAIKEEEKRLKDFEKILKKDLEKSAEVEGAFDNLKKREEELKAIFVSISQKEKAIKDEAKDIKKIVENKSKDIREIEKELGSFEIEKNRLMEDIELIKKISRVLNVPAKDMDKKVAEVEERVLEIRKLNNTINRKYGVIKKLFSGR